jgi:hypothetical protein
VCLFITVAPCTADVNRSHMKRVLQSASVLSAFLEDRGDQCAYYLANDRHCACDLLASGADLRALRLKPAAARALSKIVDALGAAGLVPFELRVFWANQPVSERLAVSVAEVHAIARENRFTVISPTRCPGRVFPAGHARELRGRPARGPRLRRPACGGGVMDPVNAAQALVRAPQET